jgi:tRNA pseudouridine55 synthase
MEVSVNNEETADLASFLMTKDNFSAERLKTGAILLLDKPEHWSSFKLVKKVKYFTKAARVGHAGTLDPLATGLLIICTGKCTKMIEKIQDLFKVYTGVFNFGKTTPSFDLETDFDGEYPYLHITDDMLNAQVRHMTGEIEQTPPVYSAIKINGTRAYKFARNGEEVEIKSRKITIYDFSISGHLPNIAFEVKCSKGTYIRTLAHDFAQDLNSGCYLTDLRRTAIGDFRIDNAFSVEEFQEICGF